MNLKRRLYNILQAHIRQQGFSHMEQMRLMVFWVSAAMAIAGMPIHFLFHWVGNDYFLLRSISAAIWLSALVVTILYWRG